MRLAAASWLAAAMVTVAMAAFDPNEKTTQCCDCLSLMPKNPAPGSGYQKAPSPFKIVVNSKSKKYKIGEEVDVEIVTEPNSNYTFREFMLVAWPTDNRPKTALGTFRLKGNENKEYSAKFNCFDSKSRAHAIMTADLKPKRRLLFGWETPDYVGHVEFRATFVVNDDIYWVAETSGLLQDPRQEGPPLPRAPAPRVTAPINTDECGVQKGCYREPEGCWEPQCEYIVTWVGASDTVTFELGGLADSANDRYVAVALSNDTYMGEDMVFACAHNSQDRGSVTVYLSYNDGNNNIRLDRKNLGRLQNVLSDVEGSYHNGRLRCRFTVKRDIDIYYPEMSHISAGGYHLLMSRGFAGAGRLRRHGLGVNELPIASPSKVDFYEYANIGDRARYPLVKAHGCLMILAWIFFSSIGILFSKYYQNMWPNKRMFDRRYWFVAHANCMTWVFILVVIAVILIFIEADGWSKAPDLPQRAHPILGIIIFICVLIAPIFALLRPGKTNKCRPVCNWFYWIFLTIANVLAIPNIFIGMDFGKANVPWWATWILVIWVLVHLIVELSLEVHQCCTYKKNKERRRKYEQQKRENPKLHIPEPEPAGRRFKRFMLFLHLIVTTITTLILVIVIAVC